MSPENQEELDYLREALAVLKQSLAQEENHNSQTVLQIYIEDIERRIAEALKKSQAAPPP